LSKAIDVSLGVGATYADEDYMETYFGVSPSDADRTALPVFEADGGIKDVRILPAVVVHLSEFWHVGVGARYQRLLGDAEDSPVVDDRGSADQFMAGLAVAYSW
jgi:outer membrane protein